MEPTLAGCAKGAATRAGAQNTSLAMV